MKNLADEVLRIAATSFGAAILFVWAWQLIKPKLWLIVSIGLVLVVAHLALNRYRRF